MDRTPFADAAVPRICCRRTRAAIIGETDTNDLYLYRHDGDGAADKKAISIKAAARRNMGITHGLVVAR